MRTTVEISNDRRAKLLELAARRGEKGFSRIIEEAIDAYFEQLSEEAAEERKRKALAVLGTLSEEGAEAMREAIRDLRRNWQ